MAAPDLAPAHPAVAQFQLGLAMERAGRRDDAVRAFKRAVSLQPDLPLGWLTLADQLRQTGDSNGAAHAYLQHLKHAVRDPVLMHAAAALSEGRIPDAEALLRDRLRKTPTDIAAIRMLAELAARIGRDEDAVRLLSRCLKLAPGFHAARQNYALVLNRAEHTEQALEQIEQLLVVEPGNPAYRNQKAVILCKLGEYETALRIYDDLVQRHPDHAGLWMSYGHALKTAGRGEAAVDAYRRSITIDPRAGEAWWSLANLKTFRFSDADIEAMRGQLAGAGLDVEQRFHFEFALGKALEDRASYEQSFAHYQHGNALRRETVRYSADENQVRLHRSMEIFTADFFRARTGSGCAARDPIFIVGLPRAGSTLIEQILSSHPLVEGTMELPEIIALTRELRQRTGDAQGNTYHDVLADLDADQLRGLGEQYLERTRVHRKRGAPMFIDKMPNNFAHIGLIQLALPNARIIDARRHPLACGFSVYKQHFARGQHFSYDLGEIGRFYRDYASLMAHWDSVLPGRIHRVHYERMVEHTEAEVRSLLDYCGLPFDAACLRFFENARPVRTASSEQVRQPIYREGIDHWRNYQAWLGPLQDALGPTLDEYPDTNP